VSERFARVVNGQVILIGDASGSVDAITGEGLSLAFCQAVALAGALRAGDPARYQLAHHALIRRPALAASFLLMMDRLPTLRRMIVRLLAARPRIFTSLLAWHTALPQADEL
jgi:flavin-dependent dehydrogenase